MIDRMRFIGFSVAAAAALSLPATPSAAAVPPEWTTPVALNSTAVIDYASDDAPRGAADGLGNWYAVWESDYNPGDRAGRDQDIVFARSADGGASWTTATLVNTDGTTDTRIDLWPALVAEPDGHLIVGWRGAPSGEPTDCYVAVSSNQGNSWSPPLRLNDRPSSGAQVQNSSPSLSTDGHGTCLVLWQSRTPASGNIPEQTDFYIRRSTDHGQTWSAPALLSTPGFMNQTPFLRVTAPGHWTAVWSSNDTLGGTETSSTLRVVVSRTTDGGVTWSSPAALNISPDPERVNGMWADSSGRCLVWLSRSVCSGTGYGYHCDPVLLSSQSPDEGAHWSTPEPASFVPSALAIDNTGRWIGLLQTTRDIYSPIGSQVMETQQWVSETHSDNGGTSWSAPAEVVRGTPGDVVSTGGRTLLLSSNTNLGDDYDIFAQSSTDAAQSWSAAVPVNDYVLTDSGQDYGVELATDGAGHWLAVWISTTNLNGQSDFQTKVFASRSTDNGQSWSAPIILPFAHGFGYALLSERFGSVVYDGQGGWFVFHEGMVSRSADGGLTWSSPVTLGRGIDQAATDGQGHWVAVGDAYYTSPGSYDSDIDCFGVWSDDNATSWSAPFAINPGYQTDTYWEPDQNPAIATDGAGHWIAAWEYKEAWNTPIGSDGDIAMRLSSDQGHTWSPLSVPFNNGYLGEQYPRLRSDGHGTWVMVWSVSNPLFKTVVSRSTDNGVTWSDPVPLGANCAFPPSLATDGHGVWLLLINDSQNSSICYSTDGAQTWSAPFPFPLGSLSRIVSDGQGGWLAAGNAAYRPLIQPADSDADVYVTRTTLAPPAAVSDWSLYQ